ncbi:MAG: YIP1 family protein [Candidatus Sericytochromatia bacterium]
MMQRLIGILKFDIPTYEEIEHDESAMTQAMAVVGVVAVLGAIGTGLSSGQGGGLVGAGASLLGALIGWWVGAWVTYKVGTGLFKGQADATHQEMLRVLGFAQAPMALGVLTFIPGVGAIAGLVGGIWSLCTYFIAVRQGLDISNFQTVITILVMMVVYGVIIFGLAMAFAALAVMLGLAAGV